MADVVKDPYDRGLLLGGSSKVLEGPTWEEAGFDKLTGLPKRETFTHFAESELEHAKRHKENIYCLFVDVDSLKVVNDEHGGHETGDLLLASLGKVVRENIRGSDMASRWGGDEFVFLLSTNIGDYETVEKAIQKRVEEIKAKFKMSLQGKIPDELVDFSFGISKWDGVSPLESLVDDADKRMYQDKIRKKEPIEKPNG